MRLAMTASQEEMNLQEPDSKAQPVPPEVHTGDVEQDRVDSVDVGSEHTFPYTNPNNRARFYLSFNHSRCSDQTPSAE